jgi:hypothetical protein
MSTQIKLPVENGYKIIAKSESFNLHKLRRQKAARLNQGLKKKSLSLNKTPFQKEFMDK